MKPSPGLLAAILLGAAGAASAQSKEEVEFAWALPPEMAADYDVFDVSRGRPVLLKDRFFTVFGLDLRADGTNALVANEYEDVPWRFLLRLPKGKVRVGSTWTVEEDLFEEARYALTTMHAFRPMRVRGVVTFKKIERVKDADCALFEGSYVLKELKIDDRNNRKTVASAEFGQFTTAAWIRLQEPILLKGGVRYTGKVQEFEGIRQGEEPKSGKKSFAHLVDLKGVPVKMEELASPDRIHGAIRKGVEALRKLQRRDGSWQDGTGSFARDFPNGITALCLMALLHSGGKPDDPPARAAFALLYRMPLRKVYEVSTAIMAVETRYLPLEQYEDLASLTESAARESIAKTLTREDRLFIQRAADWLVQQQTREGTWGYPEQSEDMDHSNTQYAMLALKSAARCGVRIPLETWRRAANHWLSTQRTKTPKVALKFEWFNEAEAPIDLSKIRAGDTFVQGPWGYFVKKPERGAGETVWDNGYGSMTCAGLTSLLVAESELHLQKGLTDDLRKRIDTAKKQGLAYLQHNFSVRGCPPSAGFWSVFHLYYLYSLERVAVLFGIRKFGDHDWYREGAILLIKQQRDDGSWLSYDQIPEIDTAFALLFLRKATMRVATQ